MAKATTEEQPTQPPNMGFLYLQMIEQAFALRDVIGPFDALDTPAGMTRLALVENDAAVFFRKMIQKFDALIDAKRCPFLQSRIEAAGREHQERRTFAHNLIVGLDAVDDGAGHVRLSLYGRLALDLARGANIRNIFLDGSKRFFRNIGVTLRLRINRFRKIADGGI